LSRFNNIQLLSKYLCYYLTSANGKGHGVHSPFVFDFITNVLNDKKSRPCYSKTEAIRKDLLKQTQEIEVIDFGAGSGVLKTKKRRIKDIASSSLKPRKYAQLLHRIVQYYQPANMIELGTSLGITSLYLSQGNPNGIIHTFEGDPSIGDIAIKNAQMVGASNLTHHIGEFEQSFTPFLESFTGHIDFAFIDGNHRKEPTIQYFNQLVPFLKNDSILIFDDIHWSADMEEAWKTICASEKITLSIDLFFIGIVFVKSEFKEKQHFRIRY
jgi:predicted O-methyltransferase YrrM